MKNRWRKYRNGVAKEIMGWRKSVAEMRHGVAENSSMAAYRIEKAAAINAAKAYVMLCHGGGSISKAGNINIE